MEERLFENDKTELKFVHNDYTREVPPVVEIFSNRLVITSYGGLIEGLSEEEFFNGRSMPRNRELMRVFRDLDLVEQLGSGMNRILRSYSRSVFNLSENFLEVVFPFEEEYLNSINQAEMGTTDQVTDQDTDQVTDQVKRLLISFEKEAKSAKDIMKEFSLNHNNTFRENYLYPAINLGFIEMTIPDKPNSRLQKYRLTQKGLEMKRKLSDTKKKN